MVYIGKSTVNIEKRLCRKISIPERASSIRIGEVNNKKIS